jgi:serine/threonine-protein kinase
MIGQTLGSYTVVEKLGEGGMGEVYRAHDEMLDRDVALKMLRPELARRPQTAERFRAEAITLAKLDHPGIARIHGASRHGDLWFIVMEFVRGETLQQRLQRAGRLHWTEVVPTLCQLLDALEYAHRLGIVHRDMKPANVLVNTDGRVKVTDFGIARVLGTERSTRTGHVVGTLEYMSPEQVRGEEVDGRTDLYSVGIMLHELITGKTPFHGGGEYEVMMQHLQGPIPSMLKAAPDAPTWFDGVLQRALAKRREDRFATAGEFQGAIETLASTEAGLQIRPTRLVIPKATQPQPPGPTRLASTVGLSTADAPHPSDGTRFHETATVLTPGSRPGVPIAVPVAAPPPPPPPSPPVPPATMADAPHTQPMPKPAVASKAPWALLIAAAALLLLFAAGSAIAVRQLLMRPAGTTVVEKTPDPPKRPDPILDAPAPDPAPPSGAPIETPAPGPDEPLPQPPPGRKVTIPLTPPGGRTAAPPPDTARPAPPAAAEPAPTETAPAPPPKPAEPEHAPPPSPASIVLEPTGTEIDEVQMVVANSGDKRQEKEITVRFESQRIVLRDPDNDDAPMRALPFRGLDATYARTRYPVNRADRDQPAYVQGIAKGGGLFRRVPHWLTIEGSGAPLVLKLDGGQAEKIVALLEGRAQVKVQRVSDRER